MNKVTFAALLGGCQALSDMQILNMNQNILVQKLAEYDSNQLVLQDAPEEEAKEPTEENQEEESELNEGEAIKKEIKDLEDKIQIDVQEAKDEIDKMNKQIEEYKSAKSNDFIIDAAQKVLPSLDYRVVWQESQNAIVHKK